MAEKTKRKRGKAAETTGVGSSAEPRSTAVVGTEPSNLTQLSNPTSPSSATSESAAYSSAAPKQPRSTARRSGTQGSASAPRVAVIGAGPMGLGAAYELAKRGYQVQVFERDDRIGGMSASIDFAGTRIERYYHFVCKTDFDLFAYLKELGLSDRLKWAHTTMAFYYQGKLHDWGEPLALLKFPGLSMIDKARYAAHVMWVKNIQDWRPYDGISATDWLTRWIGPKAYDVLWRSLFYYKFYELQDQLSAAWIGTRIKRVALSRKNLFQEEMGYLQGGSEVVLQEMAKRLESMGASITLKANVEEVVIEEGAVRGVLVGGELQPFDHVISTIPIPYLTKLIPGLPSDERQKVEAIRNVGVVCVLLKLKQRFSDKFWLNINDPRIEIPGFIEYTNLNPLEGLHGESIFYAPYYMPQTNEKYGRDKEAFIEETLQAMEKIRPDFDRSDVIAATASRYQYAQTICAPGFFEALVPMQSQVRGLFMADTSHCYPEDRSISESLRIGAQLATLAQQSAVNFPLQTAKAAQ
jgi:protoporphyrinogen oxidase